MANARTSGTLSAAADQPSTSDESAFLADLHRTAVGQLERGERTARADTVLKLCGSLRIEPSALFEGLGCTPAEYTKGS